MPTVLTAENLSKTFPNGTKAVDSISFSLNQGEIFGFLGPNGAIIKYKEKHQTKRMDNHEYTTRTEKAIRPKTNNRNGISPKERLAY